jgi:hypothetical protein
MAFSTSEISAMELSDSDLDGVSGGVVCGGACIAAAAAAIAALIEYQRQAKQLQAQKNEAAKHALDNLRQR